MEKSGLKHEQSKNRICGLESSNLDEMEKMVSALIIIINFKLLMPPFTFQSKAAVVFFLLFFYRVSAYQCCRLFRPPEGAADDIERERKTGQRFFT